ncbi:MAG: hypothetical protein IJ064_02140 [Bacteroidaceae bacterium]|nr:hypothetical protein [Bacteroidaceae bacterium]
MMDTRTEKDELQELKAGMAVLKSHLRRVDMMQKERLRASIVQSARELRPSLLLLGIMLVALVALIYSLITEWQDMTTRQFWVMLAVAVAFSWTVGKFCYVGWLFFRLSRQEATLREMVSIIHRAEKYRYEITLPEYSWLVPILTTLMIYVLTDEFALSPFWKTTALVFILLLFIPYFYFSDRTLKEKKRKLTQITADLSELQGME